MEFLKNIVPLGTGFHDKHDSMFIWDVDTSNSTLCLRDNTVTSNSQHLRKEE